MLPDAEAVKKAVITDPKAVGYIDKSQVDGSVKVVMTLNWPNFVFAFFGGPGCEAVHTWPDLLLRQAKRRVNSLWRTPLIRLKICQCSRRMLIKQQSFAHHVRPRRTR